MSEPELGETDGGRKGRARAQAQAQVQVQAQAQAVGKGPDGLEERFADLVDDLLGLPGVTPPSGGGGFGRSALRYEGKIFAMFVRGRLVLKLPARRVDELIKAGEGVRFDANKGTPMKEWLNLDPESGLEWQGLAREALEFAGGAKVD